MKEVLRQSIQVTIQTQNIHVTIQIQGRSSLLLQERAPISTASLWRYSEFWLCDFHCVPRSAELLVTLTSRGFAWPGRSMGLEWRNHCWVQAEGTPPRDACHVCQGAVMSTLLLKLMSWLSLHPSLSLLYQGKPDYKTVTQDIRHKQDKNSLIGLSLIIHPDMTSAKWLLPFN